MRSAKAPSFLIGWSYTDEMGGRHVLPEDPRSAAELIAALRRRAEAAPANAEARERQRERAKLARESRLLEHNETVLRRALQYLATENPTAKPPELLVPSDGLLPSPPILAAVRSTCDGCFGTRAVTATVRSNQWRPIVESAMPTKEAARVTIAMTLGEKWSLTRAAARSGTTTERYAHRLLMNALDEAWLDIERGRAGD